MPTLEERVANLERRVAEAEGGLSFLIPQVREFHVAFVRFAETADRRFEQIDRRFEQVDRKLEQLDTKIDAKFDFLDSMFTNLFKALDEKVDALPRVIAELLQEELRKARE